MNRHRQLRFERVHLKLGQVLRLFVKVAKACLVPELCFENQSVAQARDVTGRDVMITAQVWEGARQGVDVARAFQVDAHAQVARDGQIIDGREVKEHGRLASHTLQLLRGQPEVCLRDVALDDAEAIRLRAGFERDAGRLRASALDEGGLYEQKKTRTVFGQALDQPPGNEARESGQENRFVNRQVLSSPGSLCQAG